MKPILRVRSTKSNRSCRSSPSPCAACPADTSPSPSPSPSSGASTSSSSTSASTASRRCSSPRCASASSRSRSRSSRAPACRSATSIAVGVFLSAGQFGLLFVGMDRGMPAGLASLVLQLQAAFTIGLAVLLLGERPRPAQLAGGALALAGIGIIAAGRAEAVPLGALALTIGAAASWGARQRRHAQGALAAPARAARLVEPDPAAAAARALAADRARRGGRHRPDGRARAALRRRALDVRRLRRLGVAARPPPGVHRRPVHAAGPGRRHRHRVARARRGRPARPSSSARRSCSAAWRSPWG